MGVPEKSTQGRWYMGVKEDRTESTQGRWYMGVPEEVTQGT